MLTILARASLDGAIVVCIVWLLTRAAPGLPSGAKAFLWWCAAAKFVVSLVWTTPILLPVLPALPQAVTPAVAVIESRTPAVQETVVAPRATARPDVFVKWPLILAGGWLLGCLACADRAGRRWRRIRKAVRTSSPAGEPVRAMTADLAQLIGLRRTPGVRESEHVLTPLVTGVLQPIVLVPAASFGRLSAEHQRMALCHELAHIKRGDLWLGCVAALAERLFFFHPFAHAAVREYVFWREAACDASVLTTLNAPAQEYGRLLINLGVVQPRTSLSAAGAPWSFSTLKRRIVMLRDPSALSIGSRTFAAAAVCLSLAAVVPLQLGARAPASGPAKATAESGQRAHGDKPERDLNFVLLLGDRRTTMSGSREDVDRARSLRRAGEELLWFRKDGREFVIRDTAFLREVEDLWDPVNTLGEEQGEVGGKQGEIGVKQGAIGTKQGKVGMEQGIIGERQGEIGVKHSRLAEREAARALSRAEQTDIDNQRRELDTQMTALDREMRKLDVQMRELDRPMLELNEQMRVLDKEMSVLNRRMEDALKRVDEQMRALIERAISRGVAEGVK